MIHLSDLPKGNAPASGANAGFVASNVTGESLVLLLDGTGEMQEVESMSGKQLKLLSPDGTGMTHFHETESEGQTVQMLKLWRNGKLIPLRDLCPRIGELLDEGYSLSPLKANKNGIYLIQATGPEGQAQSFLASPAEIRGYVHKEIPYHIGTDPGPIYIYGKERSLITDGSDVTGRRTESRTELKIAQWEEVYHNPPGTSGWEFKDSSVQFDNDVFFIRIPKSFSPPTGEKHKFKLKTVNGAGANVDNGATVELDEYPDFFQSQALCLVTDDEDDAEVVSGIADNLLNDHTYHAELGGKVTFEWLTAPGNGPKPLTELPVPIKKIVKTQGYIFQRSNALLGTSKAITETAATIQFEGARKVLATCGVKLEYEQPTNIDPNPDKVRFGDNLIDSEFTSPGYSDVTGLVTMFQEPKSLMDDPRCKPPPDVIPVYFVADISPIKDGVGLAQSAMAAPNAAYANAIFMDSVRIAGKRTALAHEFMHILLDAAHADPKRRWLPEHNNWNWCIWHDQDYSGEVWRKRVLDSMRAKILISKFCKDPTP